MIVVYEKKGMTRACWKLPFVDKFMFKYLLEEQESSRNIKKSSVRQIFSRKSTVIDLFIDQRFGIHNGRHFFRVVLNKEHVGLKFGALVITKKIGEDIHTYNRVQKKKKERQKALKQKKLHRVKGKSKKLQMKKKQRLKQLKLKAKKKEK